MGELILIMGKWLDLAREFCLNRIFPGDKCATSSGIYIYLVFRKRAKSTSNSVGKSVITGPAIAGFFLAMDGLMP